MQHRYIIPVVYHGQVVLILFYQLPVDLHDQKLKGKILQYQQLTDRDPSPFNHLLPVI